MELTLIILAAGLSTRYGGIKQLEPMGPSGEALLDYGVYDALRAGFSKVVLVIRRELEHEFAEHVGHVYGNAVDVSLVFQSLESLPDGFSVPADRRKPWGTGQAVLAAGPEVTGPFVVMNADDFYGADAFVRLGDHLRANADSPDPTFAAAGYTLRDTLSPFGGVSRAVCELDDRGCVRRVIEVKNIRGEDGTLAGVTLDGKRFVLTGDETISMNIWAATPAAFPLLVREFAAFLAKRDPDSQAEFLLSTAVSSQIARGEVRVVVIPTPGPWLGVTFPEDKAYVSERLRQLVGEGSYPQDLAAWFRQR